MSEDEEIETHAPLYFLFRYQRKQDIELYEDELTDNQLEEWSSLCRWIENNAGLAYKSLLQGMFEQEQGDE